MPDRPIYLDNHATTRVDPRVVGAMVPFFDERFGNPSSRMHRFGQEAAEAIEEARQAVATAIGAEAREIVFTSGATESNRLAIEAAAAGRPTPHFVATAIEHKSVLDGVLGRSTCVPVGSDGIVDPATIRRALTPSTVMVSTMAANNEVGTIQPIQEIGRSCREAGVRFHCDATAAVGRIPFDVRTVVADFVSFSGHKIYGPKGVGALYVRDSGGRAVSRPGTLNVPGIVGLAKALALCVAERDVEARRLLGLRNRLLDLLRAGLDGVTVNGDLARRLDGNLNVAFAGIDGRSLLIGLDGLAVSSGSACSTGAVEPSHVLLALGRSREQAVASLRFGIGRFNTAEEIDLAAGIVIAGVRKLRSGPRFRTAGLESDRVLGKTSHADRL